MMTYFPLQPLFPLGKILCSPRIEKLNVDISRLLRRHQSGDWADLCDEDREANQQALKSHEGILSQYLVTTPGGMEVTVCLMTESSITIVFLLGESMVDHFDE